MSDIKIKANSSGGGVYTLQSGAGSTDRTITLPDATGTLLDSTGQGADSWYLSSDHTGDANVTAWARTTGARVGNLGSAMSVSSGIWTFPSTGICHCELSVDMVAKTTDNDFVYFVVEFTGDNFSTTDSDASILRGNHVEDEGVESTMHQSWIMDITDTANDKFKIRTASMSSGNKWLGATGSGASRWTVINFIRLGDT
jgi:hypothetical protein